MSALSAKEAKEYKEIQRLNKSTRLWQVGCRSSAEAVQKQK
jgi:hypothetical protein